MSNMSSTSKLPYVPLESNKTDIRLLTVLPSISSEATIQCSLENASLDSLDGDQPYRALSYVWGDPKVTIPIMVSGVQMNVTTNLAAALRHVRAIGYIDKPWWIDAICINQDDIAEKGHQVHIMGDIYRNADEVLAWLGVEVSSQKLDKIAGTTAAADRTGTQVLRNRNGVQLHCIMKLEWWTRRWIIQEAVLAKRLTFLWYSYIIPWDHFHSFWREEPTSAPRLGILYERRGRPLSKLRSMSEDIHSRATKPLTLVTALAECRGIYEATMKVDYVYALLGIASDTDWIVPDYGRTLHDVSTDIIIANLANENSTTPALEFLSHCGSGDEDSEEFRDFLGDDGAGCKACFLQPSNIHVPAWVPLWDHPMAGIRIHNCQDLSPEVFSAMHATARPFLDKTRKVLTIQGVLLDEIQEFYNRRTKLTGFGRSCSGMNLVLEGRCPKNSREGDAICWIRLNQSLILRRYGNDWLIIGTGAVESMRGSAAEQRDVLTTLPLQDFRIF
jgi:hypothetical protein